uniref:DNA-directed RNA polymerase III subunit RPC5 n=1 Tax=Rhizophora mucronata TaxID=61149 RepID=A0A2P2JMR9_RHIMU
MDLDDLDVPLQAPSRVAKFAPRASKLKPQPKLKPEPSQESVLAPKPEPQNLPIPKQVEGEIDDKPSGNAASFSNGAVKMEIDAKLELAAAAAAASSSLPKQDDGMDIDGDEQKQDEDAVVREIDVFFTPSVDGNTKLYVMQYPLRACWRPYELDERCEEVRVKPTSGEVEIDLSLDVSTNWNSEFANRHSVKKQTLSTTWQPPRATGYAVGVLIGNKLHLNPIHAVVQLRPSLEHLRSHGSKRKMNITSDAEYTVKVEDPIEGKPIGSSKKQDKHVGPSNEQKSDVEEVKEFLFLVLYVLCATLI